MKKRESLIGILVPLMLAAIVGYAGSSGGVRFQDVPVFVICAVLAFTVQWIAFIPAYVRQTEHFYDLVGSVTYVTLVLVALLLGGSSDLRSLLMVFMVVIWAVRLGSFLFSRVRLAGEDRRFVRIKTDFLRFLMTWTLQGLWVFLTLAAVLAALTSGRSEPIGLVGMAGLVLWLAGFGIEVVADNQKRTFRADPVNHGRFIRTGLWAWSRHPNYFGEILLWAGITVFAAPVLTGWQWVTVISPLFVYVLLTRISGVPMLEAAARKRWGEDPEYQHYQRSTPVLVLRPPRSED